MAKVDPLQLKFILFLFGWHTDLLRRGRVFKRIMGNEETILYVKSEKKSVPFEISPVQD